MFCFDRLPGKAGKRNLMPLYNKVYDVIRKYDKETIVFYEPVTWGVTLNGLATGTGFNSTPGNDPERTSLAWHYYCWLLQFSPNPLKNDTYPLFDRTVCDKILIEASFKAVRIDKNVLNGASFLTEFGVCAFGMHNSTLVLDECNYVLNAADNYFESWTYWDSNFYDANDHRIPELVNSFSRVYPVATSGTPVDLYYNATTKLFVYSYDLNVGINEPTLIFVPEHAYPRSFQVSTTDGLLWSFNQTSRLLAVYVDTDHTVSNKQVKVMVMPIVDMSKTLFN
jgi:endoglycosylceramidase